MGKELLQNAAQALNNERFKLILFPTEKCNFRCVYCYEDHVAGRMSNQLVKSIKRFLELKIPLLKLLELEWFGGEPLLEKSIVIEITSFAQTLCKEYGVTFVSVMTTNGYNLDFDTFEQLVNLGIKSFQITFDGNKENHDKYRLLAKDSSEGTFNKIWDNLFNTRKSSQQFSIAIRCHLTAINKESVESLLHEIYETFGNDTRYFVHLKEVSALGGKNDDKMCLLSSEGKRKIITEIKEKYSYLQFVDIGKDYICYAARPNTFAIRSDGSIIKCTVAMNTPLNHVGKLLPDGTLDIDANKFFLWSQGFDDMDKQKLDCPYYHCVKKWNSSSPSL